jgi:hypothetical protein
MTARRKPRSSTFSRADRQPGFAFKTFIVSGVALTSSFLRPRRSHRDHEAGARLALLIHHDDAVREVAYDRGSG